MRWPRKGMTCRDGNEAGFAQGAGPSSTSLNTHSSPESANQRSGSGARHPMSSSVASVDVMGPEARIHRPSPALTTSKCHCFLMIARCCTLDSIQSQRHARTTSHRTKTAASASSPTRTCIGAVVLCDARGCTTSANMALPSNPPQSQEI